MYQQLNQLLNHQHIADLQREAEANRLAAQARSVATTPQARFAGFGWIVGPFLRAAKSAR